MLLRSLVGVSFFTQNLVVREAKSGKEILFRESGTLSQMTLEDADIPFGAACLSVVGINFLGPLNDRTTEIVCERQFELQWEHNFAEMSTKLCIDHLRVEITVDFDRVDATCEVLVQNDLSKDEYDPDSYYTPFGSFSFNRRNIDRHGRNFMPVFVEYLAQFIRDMKIEHTCDLTALRAVAMRSGQWR